jgi:hypothetical protein
MHPTRGTVAVLSLVLALATALTLTATAVTLASPPASSDESTANLAVVRRFYAALNLAVASGDLSELDGLLAPDLVVGDDATAGRDTLADHLLALHEVRPDLWLGLEEALVAGDRVVARVAVTGFENGGDDPTALLSAPAPDSPLWTAGDRLRVVDGRVAAFAGITLALAPARAVLDAVVALPALGQGWLGLARVTAAPWADILAPPTAGPFVYLVETGSVAVRLDGGDERRFSVGDEFVVAAGMTLALRNPSAGPATLLTAALVAPAAPWPPRYDPPVDVNSIAPDGASRDMPLNSVATARPRPAASVVATSLGGTNVVPSRLGLAGELRLTLSRLAPAPGQNLLPLTKDGPTMLATDAGRALLSAPDDHGEGGEAAADTLLTGGRASIHGAGATLTIQPAGDAPLGLLVLSLTFP